jgi:hypothetical protein
MTSTLTRLSAAAGFCMIAAVSAHAQTPPAKPDIIVTVSGCVTKSNDGVYTLTQARTEKNAPGAPSATTWAIDVGEVAMTVLRLDARVGQRLEVIAKVNPETPKGAMPQLQIQSLKPAATGCS